MYYDEIYDMNKNDLIGKLEERGECIEELKTMSVKELRELLKEHIDEENDGADIFPNGRDYDSEDF